MEYASKGVAGAALGTGIAGLALGALNSGLFGNGAINPNTIEINRPEVEVTRFGRGYYNSHHVSHYELDLVREISQKDAVIASKNSELYTNQEVCKLRDEFNAYKVDVERRFCYDEKLIEANRCEIEKVDAYGKCNYYKMDKVIRPWDICPSVELANPVASVSAAKASKVTA